ncbi:hypothetical protein HDU87_004348 [Geranomyces variabilis]|uniref:Uncharacterized protein n=1 Tax=Geranomyces variabilis TaxID=109894 RepID=A0AAD5XLZ9_9FUNG|nr:hypothetical protein HDU87_004348 [Geranomyces variabilis]
MIASTVLTFALALGFANAAPAPASSALAAGPGGGHDSFCVNNTWEVMPGKDLKNIGDLTNHPVWNKKFSSACDCGAAIMAADKSAGIRAPLFVWNPTTQGCYPKGIGAVVPGKDIEHFYFSAAGPVDAPEMRGRMSNIDSLKCNDEWQASSGEISALDARCAAACKDEGDMCDFSFLSIGHRGYTECYTCSYQAVTYPSVLGVRLAW